MDSEIIAVMIGCTARVVAVVVGVCSGGGCGGPQGPGAADDPVPAGQPDALVFNPPPTLVPNAAFDYEYLTKYEWLNTNNRQYHLVVEHHCQIVFIPTGGGKERYATMDLTEFWGLDANGRMAAREVDRIRRAPLAGQGIIDSTECCEYHVHGVKVKKGARVRSVMISFTETDAFLQADGNWYREPSGQRGYYHEFEYSPPGRISFTYVQGKDKTWSSRYRFKASEPGAQKDVLELTDIRNGGVFGPDLPRGCDFPADVRPPP